MRLIDAHKLEKEFKRIYNCDPANYQSLDWGTIKNTIRDQSKVDPVKHGYWVWTRNYTWHCSECGGLIATPGYMPTKDELPKRYRFCSQCGAKMDEVIE